MKLTKDNEDLYNIFNRVSTEKNEQSIFESNINSSRDRIYGSIKYISQCDDNIPFQIEENPQFTLNSAFG